MAVDVARISGPVLNSDSRSGITRPRGEDPGGRPYTIRSASVLVADTGVAEVTFPDDMELPRRGEDVDYAVEVTVYAGRPQFRAIRDLVSA